MGDITKFLGFVESHLSGKKFLVGDSVTLADISLATGLSVILGVFGEEERTHYTSLTAWYLSVV